MSSRGFSLAFILATIAAILILIAVIIFALLNYYPSLIGKDQSTETTQTQEAPNIQTQITKNNPDWLDEYCKEQVTLMPEPPFTFTEKGKVVIYSQSPTYLKSRVPEDKLIEAKTCRISYSFDEAEAYDSMGVENKFDIQYINEFDKQIDIAHTDKMNSPWKKISPINLKEAGRPSYSYEGMPLVFTRENTTLGTVEFATMEFGIDYFVRITVYEK